MPINHQNTVKNSLGDIKMENKGEKTKIMMKQKGYKNQGRLPILI